MKRVNRALWKREIEKEIELEKAIHPNEEKNERLDSILSEFNLETITGEELCYIFNFVNQASQKTVKEKIPCSMFSSQKEADEKYFIPRGGRCMGIKSYWEGTVNPVEKKWYKKGKIPKFFKRYWEQKS